MSFLTDLNTEGVVGQWMVDNFWNKFNGHRVDDIELQKSGVDVILEARGKRVYVDEKIKNSGNINSEPFPYPSVEILPNAEYTQLSGWWVNPNEKTQIYAFINLSADNIDFNTLQYDEINAVEVTLFERRQLKQWQIEQVASDDEIYHDACQLARDRNSNRKNYYNLLNEKTAHLKKSWKNGQNVINLVVELSILKLLKGSRTYIITKDGVKRT